MKPARFLPALRVAPGSAVAALVAVSISFAASSSALAVEPNLYIAPSAWASALSGNVATGNGASNEEFGLESTVGLDGTATTPSFEGFFRYGPNRYIFAWNRTDLTGSEHIDRTLVFQGETYPAGALVHSELDYDRWRALYGRPITDGKTVAFGYLLGIESYEIDVGLKSFGVGKEHAKIDALIPLLGVSLTYVPAKKLRIYGELLGMATQRGGVDSKIFQAQVAVDYVITREILAISAGYRYLTMASDDDDEAEFELRQKGVTTGLVFRF